MDRFTIAGWRLEEDRTAVFSYECSRFGLFEERLTLPEGFAMEAAGAALPALLDLIAHLAGVSYYKAAAAPEVLSELALDAAGRACVEAAYTQGLGEFRVRAGLDYPPKMTFRIPQAEARAPAPLPLDDPAPLVAFGGGKDSHVSAALLRGTGRIPQLASVVLSEAVARKLQSLAGDPLLFVNRRIDARLIELSRAGEALNGHVPITAINSSVLALLAAVSGRKWVVFSNERGASVPTMHVGGAPVNHQYSKSYEFEGLLRAALAGTGAGLDYFSLLRPFSELWIAARLADTAPDALPVFSSCNRNFQIAPEGGKVPARWCCACDKCVYTALLLAPHLTREAHLPVFGADLLDDMANLDLGRGLTGVTPQKPWDCVGDVADTAAVAVSAAQEASWQSARMLAQLAGETGLNPDAARARVAAELEARGPHYLPKALHGLL